MRSLHYITICFLFFISSFAQATIYASPMLNEANGLVEVAPQQAKQQAQTYLQEHHFSEQVEKHPASIARDEANTRVRTPTSSVEAMMILAQALEQLGEYESMQKVLDDALAITKQYELPYLIFDVQILKVRLTWKNDADALAAREKLAHIREQFQHANTIDPISTRINYKLNILSAEIASKANEIELADLLFTQAKPFLDYVQNDTVTIEYHLKKGEHHLLHARYNLALYELLSAYWLAVENDAGVYLAKANTLLGQLFFDRQVLDKALVHFSQAADFYGRYGKCPLLPPVLRKMGDIYFEQGKFNLALVHYFNYNDHNHDHPQLEDQIDIRLKLSATYLQLNKNVIAERYLSSAEALLATTDIPRLNGQAALLHSGLAYYREINPRIVYYAEIALSIGETIQDQQLQEQAYRLLSLGYERIGMPIKALGAFKKKQALIQDRQNKLNQISEDAFRQQRELIEQTLHLVGKEKKHQETSKQLDLYRQTAIFLFIGGLVLFMFNLRRGFTLQHQHDEISELHETLFTHSRSRLNNLRMLNAKLPKSLAKSSDNYEQWQLGELIHQPLNDRLRFALIDIPFMRNMYLQHGYTQGLNIERALGDFLKSKIQEPNRLYHFSDASLLYIEKNGEDQGEPEALFNQFQSWLNEFSPEQDLNRIIRVGMVDYPFLPRAYTAINDKELLDILLMATNVARDLSLSEEQSQWIYLKAINNAPAASFASDNIRLACKQAINQGLVKVHSSYKNEDNLKKRLKEG